MTYDGMLLPFHFDTVDSFLLFFLRAEAFTLKARMSRSDVPGGGANRRDVADEVRFHCEDYVCSSVAVEGFIKNVHWQWRLVRPIS